MKSKKRDKQKLMKYLRILTLVLIMGAFGLIGVALLANSHASTIYTIPDTRNDSNPNNVIDPTGVKDSTAGLQTYLSNVPNGTLGNNNTVVFPDGAKYRVNDEIKINSSYVTYTTNPNNPAQIKADSGNDKASYPWRARPAANNPDGRQANWFIDEYGDTNNHAVLGSKTCSGCQDGGYDGYQSGFEFDPSIGDTSYNTPFVLATYNQHPFVPSDVGKAITVCNPFNPCFNRIISYVENCTTPSYDSSGCTSKADANGKFNAVRWSATQAKQTSFKMGGNGWVSWAMGAKGDWECYFAPNPSFRLKTYSGSWQDYNDADGCAKQNNKSRITVTLGGAYNRWLNIDIHGSNPQWKNVIENWASSSPAALEFQHTMILTGDNNEVADSYIGDANGDGLNLQGSHLWVHGNRIQNTGRQGTTESGYNCQVIIENNVIQRTHHSLFDFEPGSTAGILPGCKYSSDWFAIINNTFGGPHGLAMNPGGNGNFGHIRFSGNHSTNADVAHGVIDSTVGWNRANIWQSPIPLGYFIMTNNNSDADYIASYGFGNWTHVYVANNQQNFGRDNYFAYFKNNSTDYKVVNNIEKCTTTCHMIGQVDPASNNPPGSFTFNAPGTPDPDWWWANNGPDPSNYYRDNATPPPPPDTTAPTVPGNLTVVNVNTLAVGLNWQASTDSVGVDHYNIYRKLGTGTLIKITTTTNLSLIDGGVASGKTYTYQVTAVDAAGNESAKSNSVTATIPAAQQFSECDINQDGHVDILDFNLVLDDYGKSGANLGRTDINQDNKVDTLDLSLLIDQYGT